MAKTTQEQINLQINQFASIMNGNFDVISNQILQESNNSLAFFESNFSTIYGENKTDSFQIGEPTLLESKNVPSLYYNGINLVGNIDLVDNFSELTGGVATIFVKSGNEFVRISTSLKNESGNRMVGASINSSHPAYGEMVKENPTIFRGKVRLAGKDYMSIYRPIVNNNQTIGILFVAYSLENLYKIIFDKFNNIRLGKNGKIIVLDKTNNQFIVGQTGIPSDYAYLKDLQPNTAITYTINNEKYQSYINYNQTLDLYILAEIATSDFTKSNNRLEAMVLAGIFVMFFILLAASYLLIKYSLLSRINGISNLLFDFLKYINYETKTAPKLTKPKAEDEIGMMRLAINQNIQNIQKGLEQDSNAIKQSAETAKAVENGDLTARIIENPHNPQL
ncbi:Cache 3/Cache 2 fusion domain-containing protein, partial [Helicobacter sp.]|uniref:Cache 3/Cache 2 fusion domain-containing protein n=1 Tax=Helicobacter sp. TaxID=218 RepID=UPI002A914DA6